MAFADGTGAIKDAIISDVTADKQMSWLLCPHRRCTTLTVATSPAACSAVFSGMTYKIQKILAKFLWTETTDYNYIFSTEPRGKTYLYYELMLSLLFFFLLFSLW